MDKSIAGYVSALEASPRYARQITCHKVLEACDPEYAEPARPWPRAVKGILEHAGIASLYSHQARAADLIRAGRNVVVTTPTASGKTLVYNLPFLERFLQDGEARALYLFPLKALAQDQKAALERLTESWPEQARPTVALYDGDTTDHFRKKLRKQPPSVLITNPEMLHLGILPYHERWTTFLASLSMVVLDEAHTYRGVFGSHMAQLLRRLSRVASRYGADPVHVLCTATVGNPAELGTNLLGCSVPPSVVSRSGAPRGARHMIFMDPEESPSTLAIQLLQAALARGLRTIVYCRSRRMTELISLWAVEKSGRFRNRISAYRAGFLPEERREIEGRMASGELLAVVSTSALELGIDIGSLDLCILVGYPGSIMATLQRGGRVGRKGQESAVIMLGGEDALDQFFIHNPDEFFVRPPERAVLNPENEVMLEKHLQCAAAEQPLAAGEPWLDSPGVMRAVRRLEQKGLLLRSADGLQWLAARKRPHRDVDLRGGGASFTIEDGEGAIIGRVDAHQAFRETHPGAVYLHHGTSYVVRDLDLGARRVRAVAEHANWHTRVRTTKSTEILETWAEDMAFGAPVRFGKLRVTEKITGYERRLNGSLRLMDIQPLDLPPQIFVTEGLWFIIPDACRKETEDRLFHFMGSIHALEHASIGLMPLMVMADRNDLGGISIPMHPQTGTPAVFVYDGLPGGAGLTRSAFPLLETLLLSVRRTILTCPCETGCPSCIQSPKCGAGNRPLDKAGCLFLAERLILSGGGKLGDGAEGRPPRELEAPRPPAAFSGVSPQSAERDDGEALEEKACGGPNASGAFSSLKTVRDEPEVFVIGGGPAVIDGLGAPSGMHAGGGRPKGRGTVPFSEENAGGGRKYVEWMDAGLPAACAATPRRDGPVMVFDVETRRSAAEVGGWGRACDMGVSVAVVWDGTGYHAFRQEEIPAMLELLKRAGMVVGFNSFRFDYAVLQPFAGFDLHALPGLDLLDEIRRVLHYGVSLDNLGRATLDAPKSADGLLALQWWKEGRLDEIEAYCRMDVEITKMLYEFGRDNGFLVFTNKAGARVRIPVSWS